MSNVQNLFSQPSFPLPYPGQSFFGSGNLQIYINSGTYVVPPGVTRIRVRVWGAGGSGGCTCEIAQAGLAAGGGGGGFGMKVIDTTPGTSYTVTVGAGGAAVNGAVRNNGNAGGTSSFGTAVTCTGGGGGAANGGNAGPLTAAGGTGGTSTGGDVNYSGGAGGSVTVTGFAVGFRKSNGAGGGSSGSIFGNGFAGGSINNASAGGADCNVASGGGGVGGKGGDITQTTFSNLNITSGGGGTLSAAADLTDLRFGQVGGGFNCTYFPVANSIGSAVTISSAVLNSFCAVPNDVFSLYAVNSQQAQLNQGVGSGGYSTNGNFVGSYPINAVRRFPGDILLSKAGPVSYSAGSNILPLLDGCGGGGSDENNNATTTEFKTAGAFGGGCGTADRGNNNVRGGNASIGGGGGGTCGRSNPDAGTRSGAGGNGMVIVEW